ncbi:secreted RxLR effector protein 161-like [Miscanthus floridulus]|uniref:secreted RxLR effector protein 161-like n=1 Tax=Miscanthus floridulus TaxID=154761 RepID=UPI003457FAA4
MDERLKLTKASTAAKVDATLCRSIIGSLRYLVHTRPDIAFVMGYVNCFMEDLQEDDWAVVKRLLRYVKETVDQVIVFPKTDGSGLQLTVFSDADMAGDIDGRWSTSGVLVFLGSAPISWLSLKQKVVALSTCKAKYVAATTAACQVVWLRRLLGRVDRCGSSPTSTDCGQPARHRLREEFGSPRPEQAHRRQVPLPQGLSMKSRSSSSSSKLVGNSRTSSPSRAAVFGSRS